MWPLCNSLTLIERACPAAAVAVVSVIASRNGIQKFSDTTNMTMDRTSK
jgi:hypothetical protein